LQPVRQWHTAAAITQAAIRIATGVVERRRPGPGGTLVYHDKQATLNLNSGQVLTGCYQSPKGSFGDVAGGIMPPVFSGLALTASINVHQE